MYSTVAVQQYTLCHACEPVHSQHLPVVHIHDHEAQRVKRSTQIQFEKVGCAKGEGSIYPIKS
jgi:hypothetical protein